MTSSTQLSASQASILSDATEAGREAVRPLPPGIGLGIGLIASLGLWAGLAHLVLRLIG